jgi:hypothetical protein
MSGTTATSALYIGNVSGWSVVAVGSFAGLGTAGIVWKDAGSDYVLWLMNPSQPNMVASVASLVVGATRRPNSAGVQLGFRRPSGGDVQMA